LVERLVRNEKVRGSIPLTSISLITKDLQKIESRVTTPCYNKCHVFNVASEAVLATDVYTFDFGPLMEPFAKVERSSAALGELIWTATRCMASVMQSKRRDCFTGLAR
jgi:hypothetical protein